MKSTIMIAALCLVCFAASAGQPPPYHPSIKPIQAVAQPAGERPPYRPNVAQPAGQQPPYRPQGEKPPYRPGAFSMIISAPRN
jgi:hypothetical protein